VCLRAHSASSSYFSAFRLSTFMRSTLFPFLLRPLLLVSSILQRPCYRMDPRPPFHSCFITLVPDISDAFFLRYEAFICAAGLHPHFLFSFSCQISARLSYFERCANSSSRSPSFSCRPRDYLLPSDSSLFHIFLGYFPPPSVDLRPNFPCVFFSFRSSTSFLSPTFPLSPHNESLLPIFL